MPQVVGQGRSDELGSLIQSLIAFLGMTSLAPGLILLHLRPQSFIGRADLAGNGTSHLCRYVVPCPYLLIRALLQGNLVAHLAMCKRIARDIVQSVTISQLCLSLCVCTWQDEQQGCLAGGHVSGDTGTVPHTCTNGLFHSPPSRRDL